MGKSLDNVDKMSEEMSKNCPKNVQKLSGGAENRIFGHFLENSCLFGQSFCLVALSNARPLQLLLMALLLFCSMFLLLLYFLVVIVVVIVVVAVAVPGYSCCSCCCCC